MRVPTFLLLPALLSIASTAAAAAGAGYAWQPTPAASAADTLEQRIPPPPGFQRAPVPEQSWGAWLRGLPMKPAGAPVLLYNGAPKWRQDVHVAVVDIDVGSRDLQQCADAIMRLRGGMAVRGGAQGRHPFQRHRRQTARLRRAPRLRLRIVPQVHGSRLRLRRHLFARARAEAGAARPDATSATCSSRAAFPATRCSSPTWSRTRQPARSASCCCKATCPRRRCTS